MPGENSIPAIGSLLGTKPLQSAVDQLTSAADKISRAVTTLSDKFTNSSNGRLASVATGSTPGGNGWSGKANGGGANFTGGPGGSQPGGTGWRGKANGGISTGLKIGYGALTEATRYTNSHLNEMATMDYTLNYFGQLSGQGLGQGKSLYQNQRWAVNAQDASAAMLQTQQTYGLVPNSAAYLTQRNNVGAMVGYDPTLTGAQAAGVQSGLASWSNYYRLRAYGIRTYGPGGTPMTATQQASALMGRITNGARFRNKNQVAATFGQNSAAAYDLRNMGYDQNTIQYMLAQGQTQAIGQMNGYTSSQMDKLMTDFETGGTAASKAAGAKLAKMHIGNTILQSLKTRQAASTNMDANMLPGFSQGVQEANSALTDFKNALNAAIKPLTGILGFGAGAGGMVGGALGAAGGGLLGKLGMTAGKALLGRLGTSATSIDAATAAEGGAAAAGGAGALGILAPVALALVGGMAARSGLNTLGNAVGGKKQSGVRAFFGHAIKMLESGGNFTSSDFTSQAAQAGSALVGPSGGASSGGPTGASGPAAAATGTLGAGKTPGAVISVAMQFLGTPYKWGGASPQTGFDCSGLMQYVFAQVGVKLPRTSQQQQQVGTDVDLKSLQPGDLVFFGRPAHHVAMVVGAGKIIEAPHTGANVRIRSFSLGEITNAKRILGAASSMTGTGSQTKGSRGYSGGLMGSNGSINEADAVASSLAGVSMGALSSGATSTSPTMGSSTATNGSVPSGSLMSILEQAGFKGQGLSKAYAVAMAESRGNASAFNGNAKTGDKSYGLFQINMLGAMGPARLKQYGLSSNNDLLNPLTNAEVAYKMSGGGSNWSAWSTYKNGAYKQYLPSYDSGTMNVSGDQVAQVHNKEMIIPAKMAEQIRALMAGAGGNGVLGGNSTSGGTTLHFADGSIQVNVQGVMDKSAASDAGKQIVTAVLNDQRLRNIQKGMLTYAK